MEGNEKGNEAMSEEAKDHKEPEETPTIDDVNADEEAPAPEPEIADEESGAQGEGETEGAVEEEPVATAADDEPYAPEEEPEEVLEGGPRPKPPLGKRTKMAIGLVALVAVCGIGAALGVGAGSPAAQPADTSGSAVSAASAQPAAEEPEPAASSTEEAHHTWEPVYGIVHLEKKTHKEHVDATYKEVTEYETLCNVCKQPVTGKAQEHSEKTGHTGFTTNVPVVKEVVDEPAKDVEVTDQEAKDAYALTGYRCDCGKSLTLEEAKETGVYDPADEYEGEDNPEAK